MPLKPTKLKIMKFIALPIVVLLLVGLPVSADTDHGEMNWEGLRRERIDLQLPLLVIQGSKGFLACAYVDVSVCNKTGEPCVIVSGVNSHEDMLDATVKFISDAALALGVKSGMSGRDALELLR
jgi:uncharacterized protein YunC (DUF1805 family)